MFPMNRILTILLLLLHINTSMFIPVMDEVDTYDAQGMKVADINSVYEFIDQVLLGNKDRTPQDEDDDQAHYFNTVHVKIFVLPSYSIAPAKQPAAVFTWIEKPDFILHAAHNWTSVVHDIIVPPPKA